MSDLDEIRIKLLSAEELERHLGDLAEILHACVHAGASVNFVLPFAMEEAAAFWREKVLPPARDGTRHVLVAFPDEKPVGTVQLSTDTPPNQPHRAEISKLLVHPARRRSGIGRALMTEVERIGGRLGRSLITLDTRTGDTAEPLYTSIGYVTAGTIPGYCRDPFEDRLDSTTIMYKTLSG